MSEANTQPGVPPPGEPDEVKDARRRDFLSRLGVGSLFIAAAGAGLFTYEYLSPNVLFEASPIVRAGKPDQFPLGSVTLDAESGIYLIHDSKGFYALGAICTHLGCLTAWKPELDLIACPCHGSRFNRDGVKVAGPAPQPLPRFKVWYSDDGYLMVDRSTTLKEPQWV